MQPNAFFLIFQENINEIWPKKLKTIWADFGPDQYSRPAPKTWASCPKTWAWAGNSTSRPACHGPSRGQRVPAIGSNPTASASPPPAA